MALRSIRSKLLLSYLVVTIVPVGLLGAFLVNRLGVSVANRVEQSHEASVRQLEVNVRNYLTTLIDISQQVYLNDQISFYLGRRYDNPGVSAIGFYEFLQPLFAHYRYGRPGIVRLTIAARNETLLTNGDELDRLDEDSPFWPLYQRSIADPGKPIWSVATEPRPVLRLARALSAQTSGLGMLVLDVAESELFRFIREEPVGVVVTIAAPDGRVIASHDRSRVGKDIHELLEDEQSNSYRPEIVRSFDLDTDTAGPWVLWKQFPEGDIQNEVRAVTVYGVLASILIIIVAAVISVALAGRLTSGIRNLTARMATVQRGDFSTRVERPGSDEIGILQKSFNTMVDELDRLIETNYRNEVQRRDLELRKRDAEFYALQSQVDPHFLFNTLEALIQGVEEGRPETAGVLKKLADLTRRKLHSARDLVTIRHELDTVDQYLTVLAFRLEDRLRFSVSCASSLEGVAIPRFTIQPLVENSVAHGLAKRKRGGSVSVTVTAENSEVYIAVVDDGAGIGPDELERIRESLECHDALSDTDHIGLVNVNERLLLYFGERASLAIESDENGTTVRIRVPREAEAHA